MTELSSRLFRKSPKSITGVINADGTIRNRNTPRKQGLGVGYDTNITPGGHGLVTVGYLTARHHDNKSPTQLGSADKISGRYAASSLRCRSPDASPT